MLNSIRITNIIENILYYLINGTAGGRTDFVIGCGRLHVYHLI